MEERSQRLPDPEDQDACCEMMSSRCDGDAAPMELYTMLLSKQDLKNNTTVDMLTWRVESSQCPTTTLRGRATGN